MSDPPTLEPIVYEPLEPGNPFGGWKVPQHERENWDSKPWPEPTAPVDSQAQDIEALVEILEPLVYLDDLLERHLRDVHEVQPLRVTRLVAYVTEETTKGTLHSPRAFLFTRLTEIERRE